MLRPYSNVSNLVIWDYFILEDLAHGPSYDLEIVAEEMRMEEEAELADNPSAMAVRRIVNGCYDDVSHMQPEACVHLLQGSAASTLNLYFMPIARLKH